MSLIVDRTPAAVPTGLTKTYWFDSNDTATASTPITHAGGATNTFLTNDTLGTDTNAYNPDSKTDIWIPATNKFGFTSLKVGDAITLRVSLLVTNLAAQNLTLFLKMREGDTPFEQQIAHDYYKTAGTFSIVGGSIPFYIGSERVKAASASIRFQSAQNASIKVLGWYYAITEV